MVELEAYEREKNMPYITSIEQDALERGQQQGRQEGRQAGQRAILMRLLVRRFGALESPLQEQVGALSFEQQERLAEALLDFRAKSDLEAWLARS